MCTQLTRSQRLSGGKVSAIEEFRCSLHLHMETVMELRSWGRIYRICGRCLGVCVFEFKCFEELKRGVGFF